MKFYAVFNFPHTQTSRKLLDFEVAIAGPGRKRNLGLTEEQVGRSIEVEGQSIDLKVSITEREKQGVKSDPYFSYKICTDVRMAVIYIFYLVTMLLYTSDLSPCPLVREVALQGLEEVQRL